MQGAAKCCKWTSYSTPMSSKLIGCFAFIDTVDKALRFARDVRYNTLVAAMELSECTRDPRLLIAFKETAGHAQGFIQKAAIAMDALAAFICAMHSVAYSFDRVQLVASIDRANDVYAAFQDRLADLVPNSVHTAEAVQAFDKLLLRRLSGPPLVRAVRKRTVTPVVRFYKRVLSSRPRHRSKLHKLRDTLDELKWCVFAAGKLISHLQDEVPDLMNRKGGFVGHLADKIDDGDWVYLVELMDYLQENYLDVKDAADSLRRMVAEIEQVA
ncbi:hypothetical protein EV714DRAFT_212775 [Schizophyllum commune]